MTRVFQLDDDRVSLRDAVYNDDEAYTDDDYNESYESIVWDEELDEIEADEADRASTRHVLFQLLLCAVIAAAVLFATGCTTVVYEDCSGQVLNNAGRAVAAFTSLCGM